MKHFIYTDTDILNSYLSQINGGLVRNIQNEVKDETAITDANQTKDPKVDIGAGISIPALLNFNFNNKDGETVSTDTMSKLQSGRELIDKIIHDNAFNNFLEHIQSNNILRNSNDDWELGDFVNINADYEIVDLDYIIDTFNDNFIDFLSKNELEEQSENLKFNNGNIPKKMLDNKKKEYEKTLQIFKVAQKILPATKFAIMDNCMILIEDKFLRASINSIRFKYGGKLTVLGKYTNNYSNKPLGGSKCDFFELFASIDEAINNLFNTMGLQENAKIITPIALYFE